MRTSEIKRTTAETDVYVNLNVDGDGTSKIDTGCGFLDHMLVLFAKHSRMNLEVNCKGDTYVDFHHTAEDVAMLNLVFDSKTFDFDQTTKITGIESALYSMAKQMDLTTLSSTLSGLRDSAQAKLNEFLLKMS